MLFDLRSRRRRRVVKGVYIFLAVLIGAGLIGFGVGTGSGFGGVGNIFGGGGGGGGTAGAQYDKQLKAAQKRTRAHPNDPAAWAALGNVLYTISQLPNNYVANQGYTSQGIVTLGQLKTAWKRYAALAPATPNQRLAQAITTVFGSGTGGVTDFKVAEAAQEMVVQANSSYTQYEYLAYFAYQAHETSRGDLAAAQAIARAPKGQRKSVQQQLQRLKASASGATGATGTTSSTSSTTSTTTSSTTSTSRSTTRTTRSSSS